VAPLTGHVAAVGGSGPVAAVLKDHLLRLGAEVFPSAADWPSARHAAAAEVRGGGEATLSVAWSDLWPGGPVRDEETAQAVCGLMHVHGRRYGRPTVLGSPIVSTAAAVLALTGLLASLAAGSRDCHVATGLDRAALQLLAHYFSAADGVDGPPDTGVGGPPFLTADGVWFDLEAMTAEAWAGFWRALRAREGAVCQGWPPFLFRFTTATCPLPAELHRATRSSSWVRVMAAAASSGASVCPIHSLAEQAAEMGLAEGRHIPDPWAWQPGPEAAWAQMADRDRPDAGGSRPLSGFVVLEAGSRIQGPFAARLLQLLGARVIRVERPGGDPMRGMPPTIGSLSAVWLALNAGKETLEVDLKTASGRQLLLNSVRGCDVFLHNWPDGRAESLGFSPDDLHEVNPGLVYAHTSGWGGRVADPPIATDFMVQARSGVADALRVGLAPPRPSLVTILDCLGAMLGAEAVTAGLLHRRRSSTGCTVVSSLIAAADTLVAGPLMAAASGTVGGPQVPHAQNAEISTALRGSDLHPRVACVLTRSPLGVLRPPPPWRFCQDTQGTS
jgi:CoA:oxalate CoA-transferase